MLRFVIKTKNRVTTTRKISFVKNQNFIEQINFKREYESEFHSCMRNVMRLCRWVGMFPVEGLERTSWDKLKFNLKSFYGVYYIASMFAQIVNTIVSLTKIVRSGANLSLLTTTTFYLNSIVSSLLLFITARNWSSLVEKTSAIEKASGIRINKKTSKKIVVLSYTINVFGLIEHCFALNYFLKYIKGCNPKYSFYEVITSYLLPKMPYNISHSNTVQLMSQIYLEIADKQGTFLWSFPDVLNISISIYLIAHFEKLNKVISAGKDSKSTNWKRLREQQSHLVELVHLMNDHFNYFVLLSCSCNLCFMCVQLYNTFRIMVTKIGDCDQKGITEVMNSFDYHAYFFLSFVYLMVKTLTLFHLAANVYSVAQEPLIALCDIHPSIYGIEIQRFYRQIKYTTIGVSGVFFYITRATILKVIGSLVTYELMLIQINNNKHTSNLSALHIANSNTSSNILHSLYAN